MNIVVQAVTPPITAKFTASGQRRCDNATGLGSCSRILKSNEQGKTTTRVAVTAADNHGGIYAAPQHFSRKPHSTRSQYARPAAGHSPRFRAAKYLERRPRSLSSASCLAYSCRTIFIGAFKY